MSELRLLIVEDEQDSSEIIQSLLAYYQISADRVHNAEEAIQALQDEAYDGAIVDLFLPGMDGIELVERLRQNPKTVNLPCIAVTAYNSSSLRKKALEAGYNRYHVKPINLAELWQNLHDILS